MSSAVMTRASRQPAHVPSALEQEQQRELEALRSEVALYRDVIRRTVDACESAAHGNLEARVLDFQVDGDPGRLMRAVNHILDVSDAFVREATASLEHASQQKFYRRVLTRGMPGAYRHAAAVINTATQAMAGQAQQLLEARRHQLDLADQFESTIRSVVSTLASSATETQATAESLSSTAAATVDQVNSVSASATETATSVQTMAAAAEELSSTIGEVGRRVEESARMTANVSGEASRTNAMMTRLSDMSHQIGRVTKLITQIAAHTKLLALNATIEAARAGEAGKGFAVVAQEVKTLAQNTASATEEITRHIEAMQGATTDAVNAIGAIAETISQLEESGAAISSAVREQTSATREISHNVHEAAAGTETVSQSIARVSMAVDETGTAAQQLLQAAADVSRQSEMLMSGVDEFLRAIRA